MLIKKDILPNCLPYPTLSSVVSKTFPCIVETFPLNKDMINDPEEFSTFLRQEKSTVSSFRDVSEMVIIASPKYYDNNIAMKYSNAKDYFKVASRNIIEMINQVRNKAKKN